MNIFIKLVSWQKFQGRMAKGYAKMRINQMTMTGFMSSTDKRIFRKDGLIIPRNKSFKGKSAKNNYEIIIYKIGEDVYIEPIYYNTKEGKRRWKELTGKEYR